MKVTYPSRVNEEVAKKAAEIIGDALQEQGPVVVEMEEGDDLEEWRRALKAAAGTTTMSVRQPKGKPAVLVVSRKAPAKPKPERKRTRKDEVKT